jgi:hypothetical protein
MFSHVRVDADMKMKVLTVLTGDLCRDVAQLDSWQTEVTDSVHPV